MITKKYIHTPLPYNFVNWNVRVAAITNLLNFCSSCNETSGAYEHLEVV